MLGQIYRLSALRLSQWDAKRQIVLRVEGRSETGDRNLAYVLNIAKPILSIANVDVGFPLPSKKLDPVIVSSAPPKRLPSLGLTEVNESS